MVFSGFLTDGDTAERRSLQITLGAQQLCFFDEQGRFVDEWSYTQLQVIDGLYRGQPIRLSHPNRSGACLTIEDRRVLPLLRSAVPYLRGHTRVTHASTARLFCWGLAVAMAIVGLLRGIPRLADPLARVVPMQWEQMLGQQITESFVQDAPICDDAAGQAALQVLVDRLAASAFTPFPFTIQVRSTPMVNAFALPGGRIVVFHGLVQAAQSPEEVAGVLAHEMAHQIQRHPIRGLIRSMGLRMVSGVMLGGFSVAAASGAHLGEVLFGLSYSREDEAEADRIGAAMLNRADIRGDGLIDFFTRYQGRTATKDSQQKAIDSAEEQLLSFLSTHPTGEERIATIRTLAHGKSDALTKEQWQALQAICGDPPLKN